MAPSKRQTTFAKMQREQAVKERRARKQQKKDDKKAAAAQRGGREGTRPGIAVVDDAPVE